MSAGSLKYKIDSISWDTLLTSINKGIMLAEHEDSNYLWFLRHAHGVVKQLTDDNILTVIGCGVEHNCTDCDRMKHIKQDCEYLPEDST